jgi:hypothetical protein
MLCLDDIAIDPTLAEAGTWMDYMGGRFLIARKGAAYQTAQIALYNEHRDLMKSNTQESREKAIEIERRLFAEFVLLDWEVVDREKNPVPYTKEAGYKMVCDPRFGELVDRIEMYSMVHKNYQARVEEDVAEEVKSSAAS